MTLAWIRNLINSGIVKAQGEVEFSEQIKDNSNAYFIEIRNTEQERRFSNLPSPSLCFENTHVFSSPYLFYSSIILNLPKTV